MKCIEQFGGYTVMFRLLIKLFIHKQKELGALIFSFKHVSVLRLAYAVI